MKNYIVFITALALSGTEGAWEERSNLWSGSTYFSSNPSVMVKTEHKEAGRTTAVKTKGYINRIKWCMKVDIPLPPVFGSIDNNGNLIYHTQKLMIEYGLKDICTNEVIQ